MKTLLLTAVILCGLIASVAAQKKDTLYGDMVIGVVTATDEATREITIKYPGKQGPEIFSGFLIDGYQLKQQDGSKRELMMSEITPGIRVRAFYKSDDQNVNGQKKKIKRIVRFQFLGQDEWVRLRDQLHVAPATVVTPAENDEIPATAPLKVHVSAGYNQVQKDLLEWINNWNEKHRDAQDQLQLVHDLNQADVLLVVARGSDTEVGVFPLVGGVGNTPVKGELSHATLYLVRKDPEALKVLWTRIAIVFSAQNIDRVSTSRGSVTSELEKRMKARTRKPKT